MPNNVDEATPDNVESDNITTWKEAITQAEYRTVQEAYVWVEGQFMRGGLSQCSR